MITTFSTLVHVQGSQQGEIGRVDVCFNMESHVSRLGHSTTPDLSESTDPKGQSGFKATVSRNRMKSNAFSDGSGNR